MAKVLEFVYDIACPYAYLASRQVEDAARRCGATVNWLPILLGGLYEASNAPQATLIHKDYLKIAVVGKAGSATDVMAKAKQQILARDLSMQAQHVGVPLVHNSKHPIRTVSALRLILSAAEGLRPVVTHELFKAYWVNNCDVSDEKQLQSIANKYNLQMDALNSDAIKLQLHTNTMRLAEMGAFGVPCFIVDGQFYWGQDRLFLAERALGRHDAKPRRNMRPPYNHRPHTLVYYHDFSSPWSFLAYQQVAGVAKETSAILICKPFLVGALFKSIGTPVEPLKALTSSKASHFRKDLNDWCDYLGVKLQWPSVFPILSVRALRVALCNEEVMRTLYCAAWIENKEIAQKSVLYEVLTKAGFDGGALLEQAESKEIKELLRKHNDEVLALGACGAPTFQILDPDGKQVALLWGQDRLNVVSDILCGWRPKSETEKGLSDPENRYPMARL
ncbi:hypothetical protein O6H91_12G039600 [Diphasiastrum complanatum]|uniref:Uncharacterized protein n=1 Tax=Diphasiastrum complanatum TaxID=34168 RepID=A0ACC2C0R2_DIPCM|nr:hypothetical protein O6H91_12G039600 [Diphasiastrum complanatum]